MQYTSISHFVSSEPSTRGTKAFHFLEVFWLERNECKMIDVNVILVSFSCKLNLFKSFFPALTSLIRVKLLVFLFPFLLKIYTGEVMKLLSVVSITSVAHF
jgi:hypothetical protein